MEGEKMNNQNRVLAAEISSNGSHYSKYGRMDNVTM